MSETSAPGIGDRLRGLFHRSSSSENKAPSSSPETVSHVLKGEGDERDMGLKQKVLLAARRVMLDMSGLGFVNWNDTLQRRAESTTPDLKQMAPHFAQAVESVIKSALLPLALMPGGVAAGDALIVYVVSGILTGVVRESYLAGQRTAVVGQRPAMAGESVREDVDWYTDRLRQQRNDRDQAADQQ